MLTRPVLKGVPRLVRVAVPAALVLFAFVIERERSSLEALVRSPYPVVRTLTYDEVSSRSAESFALPAGDLSAEQPFRSGETLSRVLESVGLGGVERHQVAESLSEHADLRRIKPNDRYATRVDTSGQLREFVLRLGGRGRVSAVRANDGTWQSRFQPFEKRVDVEAVGGVLEGALETAIQVAGGESNLAFRMADVLQWDIDFTRDLRLGDTFEILYERVYLDGEFHSLGKILALEYRNGGREIEAYHFGGGEGAEGYYDAEGRPMRKMFLRSPMRYSRVTSRFSNRRFHPVLKRYRPHYGVDYGAPTGTPVRVTANGVVVSAGWLGGGGNTVKVRHPNGYTTAYLHLSKFAKGVRSGTRVAQGEVIGYVGSTGLSTGPHLDYRVQHNGRWIDPLTLKAVPADPIPEGMLAEFSEQRDRYRDRLHGVRVDAPSVQLAEQSPGGVGAAGGR